MNDADKTEFHKSMQVCAVAFDKEVTREKLAIYFELLKEYPIKSVNDAILKCTKTCTFFPKIADLIDAMDLPHKLGANEAWSEAIKAMDEAKTVVWTDQIAACWGAAREIYAAGDKVGARMAFIEAYNRFDHSKAKPLVSMGTDKALAKTTIKTAVQQNRLPPSSLERYLISTPKVEHLKSGIKQLSKSESLTESEKKVLLDDIRGLLAQ